VLFSFSLVTSSVQRHSVFAVKNHVFILLVRDNLLEVFCACNLQSTESISYR
jgi:hypothetical protein